MRVLVVADPISSLKPAYDSSLFIAQAFLSRGHQIVWAEEASLSISGYRVGGFGAELKPWRGQSLPEIQTPAAFAIEDFDFCLIRKDPPFDENYLRLSWLLAPYEKKLRFVNRPSLLARYHEKMLPLEALIAGFLNPDDLIPSLQSRRREDLQKFLMEYPSDHYVAKPWLGYQGNEVALYSKSEIAKLETFESQNLIIQPFAPEVKSLGDRRVLFFKGSMVGHFVRMPKEGGFVSNTAQGGSATKRDLNKDEQKLIWKIEKFLQAVQIDFAGADLIGHRLNEINITSPTGLRICEQLYQQDLGEAFVKAFEGN